MPMPGYPHGPHIMTCFGVDVNLPGIVIAETKTEFRAPLKGIAKYTGRLLGRGRLKGECATGVQSALWLNGVKIGRTRHWKPGRQVRGNDISPGTAIASFRNGAYENDHAAIFVKQDAKGITVYDQYNHPRKPWGMRILYFKTKRANDYSNDGDYFYTITTD